MAHMMAADGMSIVFDRIGWCIDMVDEMRHLQDLLFVCWLLMMWFAL